MPQQVDSQESACIEGLYDVLTDAKRLPGAVSDIREYLGGTAATMFIVDRTSRMISLTAEGTDPAWIAPFIDHFSAIDPTRPFVEHSAPGHWVADDRLLDPDLGPSREYVNDFARHAGVRWLRGGKIMQDQNGAAFLTVHKPADAKPFDNEVIRRLNVLHPHLSRVSRLLLTMPGPLSALAEAEEGIRRIAAGVCVVDSDGRVRYSNPAAAALMRKDGGVRLKSGSIRFESPEANERFRRACTQACRPPRTASAFSAMRRGGFMQVRVLPISLAHPLVGLSHEPRALIFLADSPPRLNALELMQIHEFSVAEAELVILLAQGLTPGEFASRRGVRIATIRSQLSSALNKTGARTQSELVSLVLSLPPLASAD